MGKWVDTATEVSVNNLVLAAAERADMLKDDGTGNVVLTDFVPLPMAVAHVNYELADLWDVLIATYEDYVVYRRFIDVVADQEDYPLPEDFYKSRKVFPIISGRRAEALRRFDLEKLGEADSLSAILTSPIEETRYKITGHRLWLHPIPSNAARLELWYVPQGVTLKHLNDLVPAIFPNGWEEYIIEGVAARMLEKEESDATPHRTRQKEILQRIMILAEDRDVGEPHQMQDTEGYNNQWGDRWGY
jgi:hypothetical protein